MTPLTRTYDAPDPRPFLFYGSADRFRFKLRKHVLNPGEPWARVLSREVLADAARRLRADPGADLADVYERVVAALDAGLRFAVAVPVYLRADHPDHGADTHYFVAAAGFKVVAYHGTIRTAYFTTDHPEASAYTLFHAAWRTIRVRAVRPRLTAAGGRRQVSHPLDVTDAPPGPLPPGAFRVRFYSRANWTVCPNPHTNPRSPRPAPAAVADWLDRVAPEQTDPRP